jgi:hypothetical protein
MKVCKKFISGGLFVLLSGAAFAGSLDTLSNQTARYFMNTAQAASTSGAGIIPYNPAGTALLGKGLYLDLTNQTIFKFYDETIKGGTLDESLSQNEPTPSLPSLNAAYNFGKIGVGNLAFYLNSGICAGGGSLNWKDGTNFTNSLGLSGFSFKASSVYYGVGGGVSYSFLNDMVSVSAGARYVIAKKSAEISGYYTGLGDQSLELSYDATGVTPIFGFDVRPVENLTLGFRYEGETSLEFEYDVSKADYIFSAYKLYDGKKTNQNLPQLISFGAEYIFTPKLTLNAGTTVYFLHNADLDGLEDYFNTGFEVSVAGKYAFTNKFTLGGTCMYAYQGTKDSYYETSANLMAASANPPLDSVTVGLGAIYSVLKNVDLNLDLGCSYYLPKDATVANTYDVSYKKTNITVGVGVSCKL